MFKKDIFLFQSQLIRSFANRSRRLFWENEFFVGYIYVTFKNYISRNDFNYLGS